MNHNRLASIVFAILLVSILRIGFAGEQTALDRYVAAPDPSYSFHLVNVRDDGGVKTFVLEMTSQTWLTTKEVDKPEWKHWLTIVVPAKTKTSTALLFINGGSNDRPAPRSADAGLVLAAMTTGSVVADLRGIPSEPLVFADEGKRRTEDAIIAYTWDKFLRTGDERWPARLPMTKAAVRAMDSIQAFCQSEAGGGVKVERFVVAGGSKRGWTTWTVAAVDKRVAAIVPIVIDTLNLEAHSGRQLAAYGFFSPAIKDYIDIDLPRWTGTPQLHALMQIEDPYSYRDRFTMPKLLINSTGDQYFLPDNSQFYFDGLPGIKYLRYVPNTDHSLARSDAHESLLAFYGAFLRNKPMPRFSWKLEKDGSIHVNVQDRPARVKLWQATNPAARDFRLQILGPRWTASDLSAQSDGTYSARVASPSKGWTAFMAELTYSNDDDLPPFKFTTPVRVVPDTLPFAAKAREMMRPN